MAGLKAYHGKRRFDVTAEPKGAVAAKRGHAFVIQKHDARRLHYDLRLELDGVMKSWAVTRGPSLIPGDKRLAVQVEDSSVITVEGLSDDHALTPLQTAFRKHHALQCGFCTPGMLTTAHALLTQEPDADADRIRMALSGNLCRCTGYNGIVDAIMRFLDANPVRPDLQRLDKAVQ